MTLEEIADRFGVDIHPALSADDADRYMAVFHAALSEVCHVGAFDPAARCIDLPDVACRPTVAQCVTACELALAAVGREPLTENERMMGAVLSNPQSPTRGLVICRLYDNYRYITGRIADRLADLGEVAR